MRDLSDELLKEIANINNMISCENEPTATGMQKQWTHDYMMDVETARREGVKQGVRMVFEYIQKCHCKSCPVICEGDFLRNYVKWTGEDINA